MPGKGGSTETRTRDTQIQQQTVILPPVKNSLWLQFSSSGDKNESGVLWVLNCTSRIGTELGTNLFSTF